MSVVVVERSFPEPVEFAAVQEQELRFDACLKAYGVSFLQTVFSRDRRRMICLYAAPDAEAVRSSQRQAGMPFERVWSGSRHALGEGGHAPIVVVERVFAGPMSEATALERIQQASSCLALHRVVHRETVLARDGLRMVCVFAAPDAEAVRTAQRQVQVPFTAVWPATLHRPEVAAASGSMCGGPAVRR